MRRRVGGRPCPCPGRDARAGRRRHPDIDGTRGADHDCGRRDRRCVDRSTHRHAHHRPRHRCRDVRSPPGAEGARALPRPGVRLARPDRHERCRRRRTRHRVGVGRLEDLRPHTRRRRAVRRRYAGRRGGSGVEPRARIGHRREPVGGHIRRDRIVRRARRAHGRARVDGTQRQLRARPRQRRRHDHQPGGRRQRPDPRPHGIGAVHLRQRQRDRGGRVPLSSPRRLLGSRRRGRGDPVQHLRRLDGGA